MNFKTLPISSAQIINVEKIPLSLCCISGIALVVNVIECPLNCEKCPWESNLNSRSARIVQLDLDTIENTIKKYKPDILFIHGGEPWRYDYVINFLFSLGSLDILKGIKINGMFINQILDLIKFVDVVDIILIEITSSDINLTNFLKFIEKIQYTKHVEIVAIYDACKYECLHSLIDYLTNNKIIVPINIVTIDENNVDLIVDKLRKKYLYIHTINSTISEYSSILCANCGLPMIVRENYQVIKINLDEECRCKYCKHRAIKSEKNICKARKIHRIPITIPIA